MSIITNERVERERDILKAALKRIYAMRSICRGAGHFKCAEAFGRCIDIARAALSPALSPPTPMRPTDE